MTREFDFHFYIKCFTVPSEDDRLRGLFGSRIMAWEGKALKELDDIPEIRGERLEEFK